MGRVRPRTPRAAMVIGALAAAAMASTSRASLEFEAPTSFVRIPAASAWAPVAVSDFTVLVWAHPDEAATWPASLLEVDGALRIELTAAGEAQATLLRAAPAPMEAGVVAPGSIPRGVWSLIAVSYSASGGVLQIERFSDSGIAPHASGAGPGFAPGAPTGPATIGASGGLDAMTGVVGSVTLRLQRLLHDDLQRVWDSRWFPAPYGLDTTADGGVMNGEFACRWMTGHAINTDPNNGVDDLLDPHEIAAVLDEPVTTTNLIIYDRTGAVSPDNVSVVRPVESVEGVTHASPFETGDGGFFLRQIVVPEANDYPDEDIIPHPSPKARRLITGPVGPMRVMTSANSRGVRSDDGSGSPGNYAHGFFYALRDHIAGVLNRPASTGNGPWFGFDCTDGEPYVNGNAQDITNYDFSRFWSGSAKQAGTGPGRGLLLRPMSTYAIRTRPEGLMLAEAPLRLEAYVLRFPGSGPVRWTVTKSEGQGGEGVAMAPAQTLDLDSTQWSHAYSIGPDTYSSSQRRLILDGDCTGDVEVGWAVHVARRISVITSMDYDLTTPGKTTMILSHRFTDAPMEGETLEFGPWEYITLGAEAPALAPGDPAVWRGLNIESISEERDLVLFGITAWRDDVDGFLFGSCGWGGRGYALQLEEAFPGATEAFVSAIRPDIWLQMFAQQNSPASSMATYSAAIEAGAPDAAIVWMGDVAHFNTLEAWHRWILLNAESDGYPAVSLLRDPRVGSILDQFADGSRADTSHLSIRGNERLAALWFGQMETALPLVGSPADIDIDGDVDFADLNYLLSRWGETGDLIAADLDRDGDVDFADLNLLLSAFNQGP